MQRQAVRVGVVLAVLLEPAGLQLCRPRQHRKFAGHSGLQIAKRLGGSDAREAAGPWRFSGEHALIPDAGQVRLAIRGAWRGRKQVNPAISGSRSRGRFVGRPLRQKRRGDE